MAHAKLSARPVNPTRFATFDEAKYHAAIYRAANRACKILKEVSTVTHCNGRSLPTTSKTTVYVIAFIG